MLLADAVARTAHTDVVDFHIRDFFSVKRGDIVHLHWFSSLYHGRTKSATFLKSLILDLYFRLLHAKGALLFWTVNNVISHDVDFPELEEMIVRRLIFRFDGLFAFGEQTARILVSTYGFPKEKIAIAPHGTYKHYYANARVFSVRDRYGFDENLIYLFFGLLRPYKGLENLIEAFNDGKHNLLIVGGGHKDYIETLLRSNTSPTTIVDARRVPDEEISGLFESIDAVILPFERITMSGTMILALSYKKFVITVADGDVPSYVHDGMNGYLMNDNSPASIRSAIHRVDRASATDRQAWENRLSASIEWDSIGTTVVAAYSAAKNRRKIL